MSRKVARASAALLTCGWCVWVNAAELYVNGAAANASDANPGTRAAPLKTINAAARRAKAGDEVVVAPGVYREHVNPAEDGVSYRSEVRHGTVVKGSVVWKPVWTPVEGMKDVWSAPVPERSFYGEFPDPFSRSLTTTCEERLFELASRKRDGQVTTSSDRAYGADRKGIAAAVAVTGYEGAGQQENICLAQIVVNGELYMQTPTRAAMRTTEKSWFLSEDGLSVLVHFKSALQPSAAEVELSCRDRVFSPDRRGLEDVRVSGFVFEHCANQGPFPQTGMVSTRGGKRWIIEGCIIRRAATVGLDCGNEHWARHLITRAASAGPRGGSCSSSGHVIRDCVFEENGLAGIHSLIYENLTIERCRFERNCRTYLGNKLKSSEIAAIKLFAANGTVIRNCVIRDNGSYGVWFDNGGQGGLRFERNFVSGNVGAGIFFELSDGQDAYVVGNVIADNARMDLCYGGCGVYGHDASNIHIWHNLLYHNGEGVQLGQITDRRALNKHLVTCSHQDVRNNIFYENGTTHRIGIGSKRAQDNFADYNLYVTEGRFADGLSLADWSAKTTNDVHSAYVKSAILGGDVRFQIIGMSLSAKLPEKYRTCVPIVGARDFFGRPIEGLRIYPGPFADYPEGRLWTSLGF